MPSSFRCFGSTGQAPTTSFFGPIPDRLSMLLPAHVADPGFGFNQDSAFSALLVNKWTRFNTSFISGANQDSVSLGAFTLAPDGSTNAAQKIVESNANSQHFLSTGFANAPGFFVAGQTPFKLRLGVFAKADTRTRIVLQLGAQNVANASCKTVFDLAGGAVAVANAATNGSGGAWAPGPTSILPFGNGWYCCLMDSFCLGAGAGGNSAILARCYLDSGSGNAAESSTYAGNGTSGLYVWKCTLLPPGAWAINTVSFFDDFTDNTMSQIDLNHTLGPNFSWYTKQTWPSFPPQNDSPANLFSNSSSILTISGSPDAASPMTMASLGPVGPGVWVGKKGFGPPALFESRHAWDESVLASNYYTSWWTTSVERLVTPPPVTNLVPDNIEMDWVEQGPGGLPPWPENSLFFGPAGQRAGGQNTFVGFPTWKVARSYTNQIVNFGGTLWKAASPSTGVTPGTNPTFWTAYSRATDAPLAAPDIPFVDFSINNLHVWSVLWLPSKHDELGQVLNFFDGNFACQLTPLIQGFGGYTVYGPNCDVRNSNSNGFEKGDGQIFPVIYQAGFSGVPIFIDWMKVTV